MDIISLVIVLLILVVVIIVITRPFFRNEPAEDLRNKFVDVSDGRSEYQEILNRIRDLDFEFKLGKIPVEDYNTLREELKSQAAGVVQSSADQKQEQTSGR